MTFAAILALMDDLAKLGASPAVQTLVTQWLANLMGVSQLQLEAAIKAAKEAPPPRVV